MREKKQCFVVTYYTTAEAMATERLCKEKGIGGKLISAPRNITADCGIAWSSSPDNKELIIASLSEAKIEVQGFHDLVL